VRLDAGGHRDREQVVDLIHRRQRPLDGTDRPREHEAAPRANPGFRPSWPAKLSWQDVPRKTRPPKASRRVLIPFVLPSVPRVNVGEGWLEITPPPGLARPISNEISGLFFAFITSRDADVSDHEPSCLPWCRFHPLVAGTVPASGRSSRASLSQQYWPLPGLGEENPACSRPSSGLRARQSWAPRCLSATEITAHRR